MSNSNQPDNFVDLTTCATATDQQTPMYKKADELVCGYHHTQDGLYVNTIHVLQMPNVCSPCYNE